MTKTVLRRLRRDIVRRVVRHFPGVEYIGARRHADGSTTVTFITYDDNAEDVMDYLGDDVDDLSGQGLRVLVLPFEQFQP